MRAACQVLDCRSIGTTSAFGYFCAAHLRGVDECAGCNTRFNGPAELSAHLHRCWPQTATDVARVRAAVLREGRAAEFGLESPDLPTAAAVSGSRA